MQIARSWEGGDREELGKLLVGWPVEQAHGPWRLHALPLEAGIRPEFDPAEVRGKYLRRPSTDVL